MILHYDVLFTTSCSSIVLLLGQPHFLKSLRINRLLASGVVNVLQIVLISSVLPDPYNVIAVAQSFHKVS